MADLKMMLTQQEIERRKPLWEALSDLWLADYEFDRRETNKRKKEIFSATHTPEEVESVFSKNDDYDTHIAEAMISSGYPLPLIKQILYEEVAPVVYFNTYKHYGGEWGGFSPDWLFAEIIKNIEKQNRNSLYRTWVRSVLGKFIMSNMIEKDWKNIISLYSKMKS